MSDQVNILLVDDRPSALRALESALAELGQNLVKATSGAEALRQVLHTDFAVILLDVHMPDMDGFETARLIRQRRSSRDTPIIFITAYADEMQVSKGYSLGAVDYILAPVVPEVLRAKVGVFVELFDRNRQVRAQARSLRQRAAQLQKLAAASVEIHAHQAFEPMLRTITDTAREVVGAHQAITLLLADASQGVDQPWAATSLSDRYAAWQDRELELVPVAQTLVARRGAVTRLTEPELRLHPDWPTISQLDLPPIGAGMIAVPLTGRDQRHLGVLYLADPYSGGFTDEDEHILVQLAQIASIAIENILSAQAREANRLKDEFLATLSHELRTPLNAMLGWIRLLRNEELDQSTFAHGMEVIERNVDVQTKLIEDLLDVSRITSGKLALEQREVSLTRIVEAAIESVRPAAHAKGIVLTSRLDAAQVMMIGDSNRLQQVMWNLLTNSVKFTPAGGAVYVALEQCDGHACIEVRDTGEGIPPELLPYVFERFRQADSTSTRAHTGLGVGLAIVRHVVEAHGGEVRAESEGPAQGSTFYVRLPLLPAGQPDDHQESPPPSRRAVEWDTSNASVDPAGSPEGAAEVLSGLKVLVVDDEPDARDLLARVIRRHGGTATPVGSVREALELIGRCPSDVLIGDIAMPETDGYALIARVRGSADERTRQLPAIALTAHASEHDRERALEAGFHIHLAKPIDPEVLVGAVAHLAGRDFASSVPDPASP